MKHILFVDDDEEFRAVFVKILRRSGYDITEACDGRVAMNLVRSQTFDLVITDVVMPEKEGLETIVELKRLSPETPVIAISGGGRGSAVDYLRMAARFGARKTLAKPFSSADLLQAISDTLENPIQKAAANTPNTT